MAEAEASFFADFFASLLSVFPGGNTQYDTAKIHRVKLSRKKKGFSPDLARITQQANR
jgi:hypothetical protein